MTGDPITTYLHELDRGLRGRPNRSRVLAETEDHLRESQADLCARGLGSDEAAHEAVARIGSSETLAKSGGGRVAWITVAVIGALIVAGLVGAGLVTDTGPAEGPQLALPQFLLLGGMGMAVVTALAVWTARTWSDPHATRGAAVRALVMTVAVAIAVGLSVLAIREAKERIWKPLCMRDGVAPHHLACNPTGARDVAASDLHALVCVLIAAGVIVGASLLTLTLEARERRRAGIPVSFRG